MLDHIEEEYAQIQSIPDSQQRCAELFYFLCNAPMGAKLKQKAEQDYRKLYKQLYE